MTRPAVLIAAGVLAMTWLGAAPAVARQKAAAPTSVADLQAAVKRDPSNAKLLVALGLASWDQKEAQRAPETRRPAVKGARRSAEAHSWLGVALSAKADLPGAIAELKKAVELD